MGQAEGWRSTGLIVEALQVIVPFHGKQMLFGVVALLAAGDRISLGGLSPPDDGNDMVHGQLAGRKSPAAIMAPPFGTLPFPPFGMSQVPGFPAFIFDVGLIGVIGKEFHAGPLWFRLNGVAGFGVR